MFHDPDLKIEIPTIRGAERPQPNCAGESDSRRPRIAIMGEFSAGKSTLTNMLIGSNSLPMKVTATQLPPVWLSHGTEAPHGVDLDGNRFEVDFNRIGDICLDRTQYLRVYRPASVLELCDIIDFPGISDPNMPAEVWQRTAPLADGVLWCTHATQAWRQSEAAAWEEMPASLREKSFLLLTRIDKLADPRDRRRVIARVRQETEGLFADVFPVSLTRALAAGDDRAAWEASGAEEMMTALVDTVVGLAAALGHKEPGLRTPVSATPRPAALPASARPRLSDGDLQRAFAGPAVAQEAPGEAPRRIVPRRVSLQGTARRSARPPARAGGFFQPT